MYALVLDWQTVSMQPVSTSRTSAGALRHAQSFVTSSQPEGSASPIGIKQLKMQGGCDIIAGRAVMVYSGEVEVDAIVLMDVSLIETDIDLDVDDWAITRDMRDRTRLKSFMVVDNMFALV